MRVSVGDAGGQRAVMPVWQGRRVATTDAELPEHVALNRAYRDTRAKDYAEPGRRSWVTLDWARKWPCEEIWVTEKR